jgi:hypothetical protein
MIQTRIAKKRSDLASASVTRQRVLDAGNAFDPTLFGFEFTNEELAADDELRQAKHFALGEYSRLSKAEYKRFMEHRKEQKAA